MKFHLVKQGDTLEAIAHKHHVTVEQLFEVNPQLPTSGELVVGMKIKIPSRHEASVIHQHIVKQGESLYKIGETWGFTVEEMMAANPQLVDPNHLHVGDIVHIPKPMPTPREMAVWAQPVVDYDQLPSPVPPHSLFSDATTMNAQPTVDVASSHYPFPYDMAMPQDATMNMIGQRNFAQLPGLDQTASYPLPTQPNYLQPYTSAPPIVAPTPTHYPCGCPVQEHHHHQHPPQLVQPTMQPMQEEPVDEPQLSGIPMGDVTVTQLQQLSHNEAKVNLPQQPKPTMARKKEKKTSNRPIRVHSHTTPTVERAKNQTPWLNQ